METWEVLERAADKIERDGWFGAMQADGRFRVNERDGMCAHIAIVDAGPANEMPITALQVFARAVGGNESIGNTPVWNNAPERTKEEVISMLRAVAATEKARASRLLPVVVAQPVEA